MKHAERVKSRANRFLLLLLPRLPLLLLPLNPLQPLHPPLLLPLLPLPILLYFLFCFRLCSCFFSRFYFSCTFSSTSVPIFFFHFYFYLYRCSPKVAESNGRDPTVTRPRGDLLAEAFSAERSCPFFLVLLSEEGTSNHTRRARQRR